MTTSVAEIYDKVSEGMVADRPKVERFRKKPLIVETVLWDGEFDTLHFLVNWVSPGPNGDNGFRLLRNSPDMTGEVWNSEERCWVSCPMGHRIVKGLVGEFYPLSPEAQAKTYEPVD